ncbi:hypothetical protein TNCV_841981 [Trichonephila clavipes]|nr:hypothetical protein TNCV_841981 [Trichonephila clavipes]
MEPQGSMEYSLKATGLDFRNDQDNRILVFGEESLYLLENRKRPFSYMELLKVIRNNFLKYINIVPFENVVKEFEISKNLEKCLKSLSFVTSETKSNGKRHLCLCNTG